MGTDHWSRRGTNRPMPSFLSLIHQQSDNPMSNLAQHGNSPPIHKSRTTLPIHRQSTNPIQSVNQLDNSQYNANLPIQCQYSSHLSIQCQSSANPLTIPYMSWELEFYGDPPLEMWDWHCIAGFVKKCCLIVRLALDWQISIVLAIV